MSATDVHEQPIDSERKLAQPAAEQPPPPIPGYVVGNPGPLGLSSFALTTFVLSLHNAGAGVPLDGPNNVVIGLAFFYGGVVQVIILSSGLVRLQATHHFYAFLSL